MEGRYKSCLVSSDTHVYCCYRYVILNPIRAGMVHHPAEYLWSCYRANAQVENKPLITPHAAYLALDGNPELGFVAYLEFFRHQLVPELVDEIRQVTNGNFVFGSERFQRQIVQALGRRVTLGNPGRPPSDK